MEILEFFSVNIVQLIIIIVVGLLVGIGKSGLSGTIMMAIPLLATVLGARQSTGMMLLFFIIGDVFAVKEYRHGANWHEIKVMLPAAAVGIIFGALTGSFINDRQFKYSIAILVLICLLLMFYQQYRGSSFKLPKNPLLVTFTGAASGFSSMVGNAAGPIFAVYMLARNLSKSSFLGTSAVFFMIVNLLKLPVQLFVWRSVDWRDMLLAFILTPTVFIGIKLGVWTLKNINEKTFRIIILIMTAIAAIRLFI